MHVFLLLTQEVSRHGIERVRRELVVALNGLHKVELHAPLDGDLLAVSRTIRLAAECGVLHAQPAASNTPPKRELDDTQRRRAIDKVGKVKIDDIVANEPVRIGGKQEGLPGTQHVALVAEGNDLRAHDGRTAAERHHVLHNGLALAVHGDE